MQGHAEPQQQQTTAAARILVTGASGMLGRAVMHQLQQQQQEPGSRWQVLGLCHSRQRDGLVACDLTDAAALRRQLLDWRPSFVIHCAAERRPDVVQANPAAARSLNEDSARVMAEVCHEIGAKLMLISTDYVFNGSSPPYSESDETSPLNEYGRSKVTAEAAVLRYAEHCVLRLPILYGEVEFVAESAVTQLLQPLRDAELPCGADNWARRFPTHCADVAKVICDLIACQGHSLSGVYHWSNDECYTKYEIMKVMAAEFGLNANHVTVQPAPDPAAATARPKDAQLSCNRILQLGICHRRQFVPAIRQCLAKFLQ